MTAERERWADGGVRAAGNAVLAHGSGHLGQLLEDVALTHKSATALIEVARHDERHRWSYAEWRARVQSVAAWLAALGVGPGDRVAIVMTNQSAWLVAAAAIFRVGGVLVPLDHKLTPAELDVLLGLAGPAALVVEYGLGRKLTWAGTRLVSESPADRELDAGCHRYEDVPDATLGVVERQPSDLATLVYSSGTGGTPKGVLMTHGAYLAQIDSLMTLYPMDIGERYFSFLPTNHAIDFMCGFLAPFCCGATVVHQRTLRPEFLKSTMKRYRITHMAAVPQILEALKTGIEDRLDELPRWQRLAIDGLLATNATLTEDRPRPGLSKRLLAPVLAPFGGQLKTIVTGGAFVRPELSRFFYRLGIGVAVGYGLTEAGTVVTVNDLKPFRDDSVGAPVPGTTIRIHTPDAAGIGEVQVQGPTLMAGYDNAPELTAEAFTEDGWLRTGDLGWLDASGHLHLVGRSRNLIVTAGGKNLYPEDIEQHLDLPAEEFALFAADFVWPGTGTLGAEMLVAVVRADAPADDALRSANRRLPEHKRVHAILAWPDEFPRTASMKLKRAVLAGQIRERLQRDALVVL